MFNMFNKKSIVDNNSNIQEILESCNDIVFFYNPEDFNCIYANKQAGEALGYSH